MFQISNSKIIYHQPWKPCSQICYETCCHSQQVYLLNKRFEQHQKIIWGSNGGIQDRTIYEDTIFAKVLMDTGMMEKRDYETYVSLFRNMSKVCFYCV